jgi:hypothetical protein
MGGVRATTDRNENVLAFAVGGRAGGGHSAALWCGGSHCERPRAPAVTQRGRDLSMHCASPDMLLRKFLATAQLKTLKVCEFSPLNAIV